MGSGTRRLVPLSLLLDCELDDISAEAIGLAPDATDISDHRIGAWLLEVILFAQVLVPLELVKGFEGYLDNLATIEPSRIAVAEEVRLTTILGLSRAFSVTVTHIKLDAIGIDRKFAPYVAFELYMDEDILTSGKSWRIK